MPEVVIHSRQYMQKFEVDSRLRGAAKALATAEASIPALQLSGILPSRETLRPVQGCPLPSPAFVGQEEALTQMEKCFWDGVEERHVFVLYGLGGAGKTQLALWFAQIHRGKFSEEFYIDATSVNTIEADLANLAASKKAGKHYIIGIRWLASHRERWLLILNNADDPSLDLKQYFPQCSHGDVLITTRNHQLINYARGEDAHRRLFQMELEEAKMLLFKKSKIAREMTNDKIAEEIVTELGLLALAIAQAGAYICVHQCSLESYLDMYRIYRGELLERYKHLTQRPDDYEWTVFTTWQVSFEKLSPDAIELLHLLAFMHYDQIPEETFRRASLKAGGKEHMVLTGEYSSANREVTKFLSLFKSPDGGWYRPSFLDLVTKVRSYSLMDCDYGRDTCSIHPLVHSWIRTTIEDRHEAEKHTTLLLALSIDDEFEPHDHEYLVKPVPHIDVLPKGYTSDPNLTRKFAKVYNEAGKFQEAKSLREAVVETNKSTLGTDHLDTLSDMFELANAHRRNGELQEAEKLHIAVLEGRIRTLGDGHLDTHRARGYLAANYRVQGRFKEALQLGQQVFNATKNLLGPEARETLLSQQSLASIYKSQGHLEDAESLLAELVETQKRVLGPSDLDTLNTMELLSDVLQSIPERKDRLKDAEDLAAKVLQTRKQVSGEDHSRTLSCYAVLGRIRFRQGQFDEAMKIQEDIIAIESLTLGGSHFRTISVRRDLALTYQSQGRIAESEKVYQQLIESGPQVLGREHPDILSSIINLAKMRSSLGKWAEAETVILEELDARVKAPMNQDNSAVAMLKINLADLYLKQRRRKEAKRLVQEVTATQMALDDPAYRYARYELRILNGIRATLKREYFIRWAYYSTGLFVAILSIVFMRIYAL